MAEHEAAGDREDLLVEFYLNSGFGSGGNRL